MSRHSEVPGLFLFENYFELALCSSLQEDSMAVFKQLPSLDSAIVTKAAIPQPDLVTSQSHNLSSEEKFLRVQINQENGRSLNGEYFPSYGDEGHSLVYLRGNENLPDFAAHMLPDINRLLAENDLLTEKVKGSWRLTMNFYKSISGQVSGFPFHVDIPANGIVTMIMNIQREAEFQITDGNKVVDVHLPLGALLILSGESRYKWKHRVLPSSGSSDSLSDVERISLVLGVK